MTAKFYDGSVVFTFNSEPFANVTAASWTVNAPETTVRPMMRAFSKAVHEVQGDMLITGEAVARMQAMLGLPWLRGVSSASEWTLVRRAGYGGRKGRRAIRRLVGSGQWVFQRPSA